MLNNNGLKQDTGSKQNTGMNLGRGFKFRMRLMHEATVTVGHERWPWLAKGHWESPAGTTGVLDSVVARRTFRAENMCRMLFQEIATVAAPLMQRRELQQNARLQAAGSLPDERQMGRQQLDTASMFDL